MEIGQGSFVDDSVSKGKRSSIGMNAIVMEKCVIGNDVRIGHGAILYPGTVLKDNVIVQDHAVLGKQPACNAVSTVKVSKQKDTHIGEGSLICNGAIVYAGSVLGKNCILADRAIVRESCVLGECVKIGKNAVIEFEAKLGDHVNVQTGTLVAEFTEIGKNAFLGPHVSMALDKFMTRKGEIFQKITIQQGVTIGEQSTLLPGITIEENVIVAAGTTVFKSLKARGVYIGNPPRRIREVQDDELL
jgi:acetyltransferase-like isoleucine patch superfamily enzyme